MAREREYKDGRGDYYLAEGLREQRSSTPSPKARMQIPLTEAQFQKQVTDLATRLGWSWLHIERMGNDQGRWRTPTSGPLGKGWPDLVLIRRGSLIFAELKGQGGSLSPAQASVMTILHFVHPYYVWRPSDFNQVLEVLSNA